MKTNSENPTPRITQEGFDMPFICDQSLVTAPSLSQQMTDMLNAAVKAYCAECDRALREKFETPGNVVTAQQSGRIIRQIGNPLIPGQNDFVERLVIDGEVVASLHIPASAKLIP